jgi:hypothetical protein
MNSQDPLPSETSSLHEEKATEHDFTGKNQLLLSCPKCNHFISGKDINIEKTVARCGHCAHVFGFAHDSATGSLQPEVLVPEGLEVLKLKSEVEFRLDWRKTTSSGGRKFMLVFTLLWNLILLPFVLSIILSGAWGILLFLSIHLAVGLGFMYSLASIYLNKTVVSVSQRRIRINTTPLRSPFSGAREINTEDVKQLYVSKYTQSRTNGVPNYAYALYALLRNGQKITLVRGMNEETQRYLEYEVESYLDIRNALVPEETD